MTASKMPVFSIEKKKKSLLVKKSSISIECERLKKDVIESVEKKRQKERELANFQFLLEYINQFSWEKEVTKLHQHPFFLTWRYEKPYLFFTTKPLFLGEKLIGEFIVRINIAEDEIHILNTTQRVQNTYDTPTIMNTNPCWGNVKKDVDRALSACMYADLFTDLIDYISSPNVSSGYLALPNKNKDTGWDRFFLDAKPHTVSFDQQGEREDEGTMLYWSQATPAANFQIGTARSYLSLASIAETMWTPVDTMGRPVVVNRQAFHFDIINTISGEEASKRYLEMLIFKEKHLFERENQDARPIRLHIRVLDRSTFASVSPDMITSGMMVVRVIIDYQMQQRIGIQDGMPVWERDRHTRMTRFFFVSHLEECNLSQNL